MPVFDERDRKLALLIVGLSRKTAVEVMVQHGYDFTASEALLLDFMEEDSNHVKIDAPIHHVAQALFNMRMPNVGMKRTINGFRFDTQKAEQIGVYVHGKPLSLSHWKATLYRTARIRRYFLAGSGGLMTRFLGNKRIIPLTECDAKRWVSRHLGKTAYHKTFKGGNDDRKD